MKVELGGMRAVGGMRNPAAALEFRREVRREDAATAAASDACCVQVF